MTNHPSDSFGDLLRRYRQERGWTQEELAERATLSARAISELERGARQYPYRSTVQLLAPPLQLAPPHRTAFEQAARRPVVPNADGAPAAAQVVSVALRRVDHAHNLPAQLTSFVGRGAELAR